MLIKEFYEIEDIVSQDNKIRALIKLNSKHPIYEGHFPEQAIVPGVSQIQIISEVLSIVTNQKLTLRSATNIKYLAIIIPEKNNLLQVNVDFKINDDISYHVKASIQSDDIVFCKITGNYILSV